MNDEQNQRVQVALRLDRDLVEEIDGLAQADRMDRTELVRRLLRRGLAAHRADGALDAYAAGRESAWAAAEHAGVSLYGMLDLIAEKDIPYRIDPAALDRLDQPETPGPDDGGQGKASSPPGRSAEVDKRRRAYRPQRVRLLFVGESSPAGAPHFYLANSVLFRAMREAFGLGLFVTEPPTGDAFLAWFRDLGAWLVDIADEPVNRASSAVRSGRVDAGVPALAGVIGEARPDRLVVVIRRIAGPVRRAARLAGFDDRRTDVAPFPVRQWRDVFVEQVAQIVHDDLRDATLPAGGHAVAESSAPYGSDTLHEVMAQVLQERGSWMTPRAIAAEIERRELWRRPSDGEFPRGGQIRARATQYPHLFQVSELGIRRRDEA